MGRIKGWSKKEYGSSIYWDATNAYYYGVKQVRLERFPWAKDGKHWNVNPFGKGFRKKEEAYDFAVRWMKSHPRG